jgi:hypothetical protein
MDCGDYRFGESIVEFIAPALQEQAMSRTHPDRSARPRKSDELHPDEHGELGELDTLVDPQDPPDPSEASDPETVATSNANR